MGNHYGQVRCNNVKLHIVYSCSRDTRVAIGINDDSAVSWISELILDSSPTRIEIPRNNSES